MPNYAVQIAIFPTSNLNADAVSNNWSCEADDDSAANDAATAFIAFHQSLFSYYPATVRQSTHSYKIYNRADPIPRAPVEEGTWAFSSAPAGNPAPPEVAVCLSFQGDPESGVSQARKRGRIYFGPVETSQIDTTGRPASALRAQLISSADTLLTASNSAADWVWTVYSSVTGDSFPVTNGWVDDEFDTQRRRGRLATTRTVFP